MIQPLRTAHCRMFVTLAFVLPAVLLLGLGARRPRMIANGAARVPSSAHLVSASDNLWRHAVRTEFYRDSNRAQDVYLVLHAESAVNEPDLLLYWAPTQPQGDALPADARFMGDFADDKIFLRAEDEQSSGHLILFSLGHNTVFDTATVEKLP